MGREFNSVTMLSDNSIWIRFRFDDKFRTPRMHGEISDDFGRMTPSKVASLAQWSEHWSRKPGVEGSTPSRGWQGIPFAFVFGLVTFFAHPECKGISALFGRMTPFTVASIAQWLKHWFCKPGVEGSTPSQGWQGISFAFIFGLVTFFAHPEWNGICDRFGSLTPFMVVSLAQWLEHWSRKPGVEGSTPSRGWQGIPFAFVFGLVTFFAHPECKGISALLVEWHRSRLPR